MLGKKGIAIDDAFEVAFGVFIVVVIILLFGAHRVNVTKTTNFEVAEINARLENTNIMLGYLNTEIKEGVTFADTIVKLPQSSDNTVSKQLRYYTETFFNNAIGEGKWLLEITYPHSPPLIFGEEIYEETYSTKAFIPTFDNEIVKIQLIVPRK
jgi:hypothetical protein